MASSSEAAAAPAGSNSNNFVVVPKTGHIAVFWDIENVCVPHGKSAGEVVKKIRDMEHLFRGKAEAEFTACCDVFRITEDISIGKLQKEEEKLTDF